MSFSSQHLFFDDLELGREWESLGRTITQSDIVNFAGVSGDFNPIHMDHEFAASTPFRQPIAHGLLVLSISSGLGLFAPPVRTIAFIQFKEWFFKEPVNIGDTIKVRCKILEIESNSRGRRGTVTWHRQLINQHGKVVQEGVTVTLVEGRGGKSNSKSAP